jgi:hypothetical protein
MSTRLGVMRKKWIVMHVRDTGMNIWFGIIIWKWKRGTSIFVHDNLTFMNHIYVDVNADVIDVRPTFVLQGWGVGVGAGGHSRGKTVLCIFYFPKSMLGVVRIFARLVIKCSILHANGYPVFVIWWNQLILCCSVLYYMLHSYYTLCSTCFYLSGSRSFSERIEKISRWWRTGPPRHKQCVCWRGGGHATKWGGEVPIAPTYLVWHNLTFGTREGSNVALSRANCTDVT